MKIKDIVNFFKQEVPFELAASWDNVGFQCGDEELEVKKVVVALDPTHEAIEFAKEKSVQLLITHHPLIFSPLKRIVASEPIGQLLIKMIQSQIGLLALHTNLDSIKDGVSAALLAQLGIKWQGIIKPTGIETGFGCWGEFNYPLRLEEFTHLLKEKIKPSCLRLLGEARQVKRVGVCGGSAADLIPEAIKLSLDAFILGEIKYHPARLYQKAPILIAEVGHYESERFILPFLKNKVQQLAATKGENVEVFIFEDSSPYKIV